MLRPTAIKVKSEDNYFIRIEFDNGEVKKLDVKPYIQGSWYGRLKDLTYFKMVTTDGFTVCWPEGQDLCPDDVYSLSVSVS